MLNLLTIFHNQVVQNMIYELRKLRNYKYKDAFNIAMKNHLRVYRQLDDLYGTKETQLNTQGVTQ
jgi:hypothetical protein